MMNTTDTDYDKITPGPWKWVFLSSAGNYYLVGNDGEGAITHSGPDTADGKLKAAAPDLLVICGAINDKITPDLLDFIGPRGTINVPMSRAEVDELRAALARARGEA